MFFPQVAFESSENLGKYRLCVGLIVRTIESTIDVIVDKKGSRIKDIKGVAARKQKINPEI